MWLIVSSLSLHDLRLLFCCALSIFDLIWLVRIVLFSVAIRRASVFPLRSSFHSHDHFLWATPTVCRVKCPYSCYSYDFCSLVFVVFLSVLILPQLPSAAVSKLSLVLDSFCWFIHLVLNPIPPSFFIPSMSSLGCKDLCIVINCPVNWGCRIYRLLLWRGARPSNECPDIWH